MRLARRWLLVAVAVYLLSAPLVPVAYAAIADMEAPFTEGATVIWTIMIPASTVLIAAGIIWLSLRGGHSGIIIALVGVLMMIYIIGALPDLVQDAGMQWPF